MIETIRIEKDIHVFYVTAKSFPDAVPEAYELLHARITNPAERRYFGLSQPNRDGVIIYKAAAEVLENGEAEQYACETFTIKAGNYIGIRIKNHAQDANSIGNAFQQLIHRPEIDPQGYCLEWYLNYTDPDVICMVGLK